MIETKQQTKVNIEAQIKELELQKTNINKEDITKKNQELETQNVNGASIKLDLSTYTKGIYIIATKHKTLRIIKL